VSTREPRCVDAFHRGAGARSVTDVAVDLPDHGGILGGAKLRLLREPFIAPSPPDVEESLRGPASAATKSWITRSILLSGRAITRAIRADRRRRHSRLRPRAARHLIKWATRRASADLRRRNGEEHAASFLFRGDADVDRRARRAAGRAPPTYHRALALPTVSDRLGAGGEYVVRRPGAAILAVPAYESAKLMRDMGPLARRPCGD
jgi:hypothetical protein